MTHTIWKHMGLCMTGSCNVITLNINRIVQDWRKNRYKIEFNGPLIVTDYSSLKDYLVSILDDGLPWGLRW